MHANLYAYQWRSTYSLVITVEAEGKVRLGQLFPLPLWKKTNVSLRYVHSCLVFDNVGPVLTIE